MYNRLMAKYRRKKAHQRRIVMAIKIQAFMRGRKARAIAREKIKRVVQKFIDQDSGLPYWFNPKTGVTTWVKPSLLGKEDVEQAVAVAQSDVEYAWWCVLGLVCYSLTLLAAGTSSDAATAKTLLQCASVINATTSTARFAGWRCTSGGNKPHTSG